MPSGIYVRSEESKKNMSAILKEYFKLHPEKNPMYGKTGEDHPNFGKHWKLSEEAKQKMRDSHLGKHWKCSAEAKKNMSIAHLGKPKSEETKKKLSDAKLGEKNPNFGKHHSEETKQKIRDSSPHLSGEDAPGWKGGISFEPYCRLFNNSFKEEVRERDNHTCQKCGKVQNGRKHSVHHIHYDKQNCFPDVITLCISCNVKANHNRDYWESFFMNKLNDRGLLFWTKCRNKQEY